MKVKVSKKEVKESYRNIICLGYCTIQHLLYYKDADYYSCGVYGWSCDYYKIDNKTIISTGYSPIGNIRVDYELSDKYDKKAREIIHNHSLSYEQAKNKVNKLLEKYIQEVLQEK